MNAEHYFDWAATAPADTEIQKQAFSLSLEHWANPSSQHQAGIEEKKCLAQARERCAKAMGVKPEQLFFTSGGTESDHIPLLSVLTRPQKVSVLISGIEHPALREMAKNLELCGWHVITVAPDKNGFVTANAVEEKLQDDTAFVTVMAVNNETGAIQPVYEIADMLMQHGKTRRKPFFHVDCVQAAGKIELDIGYKGIDSAAFSAHKLGGPRGIGLLYLAKEITPFLKGGGQERNIRSGTENLFGAQAMALCMEKYFVRKGFEQDNQVMAERMEEQRTVTAQFIEALRTIPGCTIIPHERGLSISEENFSPWIVQAAFKGIPGQVLVRALSADGYYISTGSACSASKASRPILDAMQVSPEEKEDAVRFSFGSSTTTQAMKDLFEEVVFQSAKFVH